ncbi:benzoylformate decarboxylase [Paludisphaera borealis]|uniref:Benzoylformate decarboxylase n=1 Tax=Paludisphaera borealis TaxID=1387353 RepID=A0A1U7CYP5_9BACT|nr:benzoylformate decarboxylase [Paludisphaera borealis]APW64041.1 Benzoylformate decarboxylase [Paludisphaera borealis]
MASVTERCYEFYRSVGMTTMFGNPGSTEMPFLQNFPSDLRYVLGLHEASVVNMAVGYALAGDRAALVNVHTAAGMGNAMGAIINAHHCKAPLVVTAGQQLRAMERIEPMLWGRQVEVARPYVKWSYEPHRAVDVPEAIARAYHTALSAPRGPVFVSICMDGLDEDCPAVAPRRVNGSPPPDSATIRLFAKELDASKRIAIVAGEELDDPETWPATIALAERLNAAVFAPPENFRVSFPTDHPLFRGFLPAAIKPVSDALAGFDALLVLGTRMFLYYPYVPGPFMPEGIKVFHVTSDPSEAARAVAGDGAIGCARAAVRMLLETTRAGVPRSSPPAGPAPPRAEPADPTPPAFVYKTLAHVAPSGTVVVDESLSSRSIHQRLIPRNEPLSFFCTGNGILGSALPMAVGVKMSRPDRPVVCLLGDGAAQYSIQGLWTAVKEKLRIVFLVLDNREYAILKSFAEFEETPGIPGLDLGGIDFAGLAAGYGLPCRVAGTDDLAAALRDAFAADGPRMVVVRIDPEIPPLLG